MRYDAIRYDTIRYVLLLSSGSRRSSSEALRLPDTSCGDGHARGNRQRVNNGAISCNEPDAKSKQIRTLSVTWRKMNVRSEWKRRYRGATVLFGFALVPSRCNEQRAVLASSEEPRVLRSRRNFSVTVVRRYSVGGLCQARFSHDLALVTRKKAKANDAVAV